MADNTTNLQQFIEQALTMLGAIVSEEAPGVLSVQVPPSMLDLFEGRASLRLAFNPEAVDEGIELVVPGSYVLERVIAAVRMRGDIAQFRLSPSANAHPAPGISLVNAEARLISSDTRYQAVLLVNYKISLISDEDQELFYQVAADPVTGEPIDLDLSKLLPLATQDKRSDIQDAQVDVSQGFAAARKLAEEFARQQAANIQYGIDQRLKQEIARLDGYYEDLRLDQAKGNGSKDIKKVQKHRDKAVATYDEMECAYKIAHELLVNAPTRTDLNVTLFERRKAIDKMLAPFTWQLIHDEAYYQKEAQQRRERRILNKAEEIAKKLIHLTLQSRIETLDERKIAALDELKKQFETEEAANFNQESVKNLQVINEQLQTEKAQRIAELQDKFQLKVVISPISASLIWYPRTEYKYTAVNGAASVPFSTYHNLVTGTIETPACRSCGQEISVAYACTCGLLVCGGCHRECHGCGKSLCVKCAASSCDTCGQTLCSGCVHTCTLCSKHNCPEHTTACRDCGREVCNCKGSLCSYTCVVCSQHICKEHAHTCPVCQKQVCSDDMRTCAECGVRACSLDVSDCPSCGKASCKKHKQTCVFCGQLVCGTCLDASGFCTTCAGIFPLKDSTNAARQIISELSGKTLRGNGRWYAGENGRQFILAQSGLEMRVYVVDKSTCHIRSERILGVIKSLRARHRFAGRG